MRNSEAYVANGRIPVAVRILSSAIILWGTAGLCDFFAANAVTAAMLLLLEILAFAALGDRVLALSASMIASLAFSYYFIDTFGSFRLTTLEGTVTFLVMVLTAVAGTQLSIRAQKRALEAIRRREEMERLNQLGRVLLAADTLADTADNAVRQLVVLFELKGAVLRVEGARETFQSGEPGTEDVSVVVLDAEQRRDVLELHGAQPSEEVRNAMASLIHLALERARSAEARAKAEAIRRTEEFQSTVFNALAHNFMTPLTSIKAAASMMRGSENDFSTLQREMVAVIDEEADRLNQLIRESLDLAKLEARRANPMMEECPVAAMVNRAVARTVRYFGRREFIIDIEEDLPPLTGDSFLFEQMLVQVVDNAWKYSLPGARIQISGVLAGSSVVLTIRNEGSEIPESDRERIFERFFRGGKERSSVEGSGLGLAIAKTIVEAYEGRIWLDMEPKGPAFHFALPLRSAGRPRDRKQNHITH
jgi:two-component system, OmpR family, sensor histidine kinase KdpD